MFKSFILVSCYHFMLVFVLIFSFLYDSFMHRAYACPLYSFPFSVSSLQTLQPNPNIRHNASPLPPSNIPSFIPTPSPPSSYPLISIFSSILSPPFFMLHLIISLEREVSQFRAWMNLKLSFHFPALFKIIFDSDAMSAYERLFTTIMKVC